MAPRSHLVEIDSLTAVVIIDNEIDILSSTPSIMQNKGKMQNLCMAQEESVEGRGEVKREMPMEAICCGAHGLSILVVRSNFCSSSVRTRREKRRGG